MNQNEKKGTRRKAYSSKKVVRRSPSCRTGDDGLELKTCLTLRRQCNSGPRVVVYQALFWPRFRMCRDCLDSLPDRCGNENGEGPEKTAVSWICELLYSKIRVGVVGSQLFSAAGNAETGFSNLISIVFITALQSFFKEGACQG